MTFNELSDKTILMANGFRTIWVNSDFRNFGQVLNQRYQGYLAAVRQELNSDAQIRGQQQSTIRALKEITEGTDYGHLFVNVNVIKDWITKNKTVAPLLESEFDKFLENLEYTRKNLNSLFKTPAYYPTILDFLDAFNKLETFFVYTSNCIVFCKKAQSLLLPEVTVSGDEKTIAIEFENEIPSLDFLDIKIGALNRIYIEICFLFEINPKERPLVLIKLESGSLFGSFKGPDKIIEFFEWFFKESLKFLHRNYTDEGKIAKIPGNLAMLNQAIDVHKKLSELMPEEEYKLLQTQRAEELNKCFGLITKDMQKLLAGEVKVRVNLDVISLPDMQREKYLSENRQRFLEAGNKED